MANEDASLLIIEVRPIARLSINLVENSAELTISEIETEIALKITPAEHHPSEWYSYSDRYRDDY